MPASEGASGPAWFSEALLVRPRIADVATRNGVIRTASWGEASRPAVVLVHGNSAHWGWWSFLAPFLLPKWHVIALDLAGMGDSPTQTACSPSSYAEDIADVIAHHADSGRARLVSHSFGGLVSIVCTCKFANRVDHLVLVDTPIHGQAPAPNSRSSAGTPRRIFPSEATAMAAYRLLPPQECRNEFLVRHVAAHSLGPRDGGWSWKYQTNPWHHDGFSGNRFWQQIASALRGAAPPVDFIRGELSSLCTGEVELSWAELRPDARIVVIPHAAHHVMLDQPLRLIETVRQLMDDRLVPRSDIDR